MRKETKITKSSLRRKPLIIYAALLSGVLIIMLKTLYNKTYGIRVRVGFFANTVMIVKFVVFLY